jgi:hypothetical protein
LAETPPLKRIALTFPVFSHVLPKAFETFLAVMGNATRSCPGYAFDVMVRERELIHSAMNHAVDAVLKAQIHEAMIVFDDDCLPPVWAIRRLLAHLEHGHHMVCGVGVMRGYPHTTTVGRYYPEKRPLLMVGKDDSLEFRGFEWLDAIKDETRLPESGLIPVDFSGFPIAMFSRALLEAIEKPAFGHRDESGGESTHDVFFCNRVQAAGYPIYVDPDLACGHIISPPIVTLENRHVVRDLAVNPPTKG